MTGTYTKAIIVKNQNHIKKLYTGHGGMTAFARNVQDYMDAYDKRTPHHAILEMVRQCAEVFLCDEWDCEDYLHSLGLTDDKKLAKYELKEYYRGKMVTVEQGPFALYAVLMARDGEKLYNTWVKAHPVKR